jgi:membrane protease YdiL (CAAX protease family)
LFLLPDGRLRPSWRFVVAVLWVLIATSVAATIAQLAFSGRDLAREAVFRPALLLFLLLGFRFFLRVLNDVRQRPLAAMGLDMRHRMGRQILAGLAIGTALVGATVAVIGATGNLTIRLALNDHTAGSFFAVVFILATAAMAEEAMFRGYPFQSLVEAAGPTTAIVILSALFGFAHFLNPHFSWPAAINTIVIGILLAIAYLRTRSLWLPWGIHFAWNFVLGVVLGLPVSGVTKFAVLGLGTAAGPSWATGGSYGIEASWTATGIVLVGIAVTWWVSGWHALQRQSTPATLAGGATAPASENAHLS